MQRNSHIPLLTIVVPVGDYRPEHHPLEKWILDIDFSTTELILVHDTNSPYSRKLLKDQLAKYDSDRLHIHEVECKSPGLARNFGLMRASGDYVVFWDADDLPLPRNVISELIQADSNSDIIVGSFARVQFGDFQIKSTHHLRKNLILTQIALDPGIWRMIFRKELVQDLRFKEYLMGEDAEFLCNAFSKSINLEISNTIFYNYYVGSSFSLSQSDSKLRDIPLVLSDVFKICEKQEFRNEFSRAILLKISLTYLKNVTFRKRIFFLIKIPKMNLSAVLKLISSLFLIASEFFINKRRSN